MTATSTITTAAAPPAYAFAIELTQPWAEAIETLRAALMDGGRTAGA